MFGYLLLCLGIFCQMLLLSIISATKFQRWSGKTIRLGSDKRLQTWGILFALSAILILLDPVFSLSRIKPGFSQKESMDTVIFVLSGLYVFFFGILSVSLLPPINQQGVFVLNLVVGLSLVDDAVSIYQGVFLFLTLLGFLVFFGKWRLNYFGKALLYFWYLILLIHLAWWQQDLLEKVDFRLLDYFVLGTNLIFLGIHILFSIRFFLMISACILPRNRRLLKPLMGLLYSDESIPQHIFWALLIGQFLIYGISRYFRLELDMLINLLLLLFLQGIFLQMRTASPIINE